MEQLRNTTDVQPTSCSWTRGWWQILLSSPLGVPTLISVCSLPTWRQTGVSGFGHLCCDVLFCSPCKSNAVLLVSESPVTFLPLVLSIA